MKKSRIVSMVACLALISALLAPTALPALAAEEPLSGITDMKIQLPSSGGLQTKVVAALYEGGQQGNFSAIKTLTLTGLMNDADFRFIRTSLGQSLIGLNIREVSYTGGVTGGLTGCSKLEWVKLPFGTEVPDNFFYTCTSLKTVGDTEGVVDLRAQKPDIGNRAFYEAHSIEKVLLPESASLGVFVFQHCALLKTVGTTAGVVDLTNPRYSFGIGVFASCESIEWVKLCDDFTFTNQMFSACDGLKTIGDTEGVIDLRKAKAFGSSLFSYSDRINNVLLPPGVFLPASMFESCSALDTIGSVKGVVDLRNAPLTYGNYLFYSCTNIKRVRLPDGASLGLSMFLGNSSLKTVGETEGVVDLSNVSMPYRTDFNDYSCFNKCTSIERIKLPNGAWLTYSMFFQCTSLKTAGEVEGVLDLRNINGFLPSASSVFAQTAVEKVLLPNRIALAPSTFNTCKSLRTVGAVDGVVDLRNVSGFGDMAFYECGNIEKVLLADGADLSENSTSLFSRCGKLSTVGSADGIIDLSKCGPAFAPSIFAYCSLARQVRLPQNAELGDSTFAYSGLKTVGETEGVADLRGVAAFGNATFGSCQSLERVLLPKNAVLPGSLFISCRSLKTVGETEGTVDLRGVKSFGNEKTEVNIFNGCASVTKVILADDAYLPTGTFYGCSNLYDINLTSGQRFASSCLAGCGFDFTDVSQLPEAFLKGIKSYASGQLPRIYFSLSVDYDTQVVLKGGAFTLPSPVLRTKSGMTYSALAANKSQYSDWLSQSVSVPAVTTKITFNGGSVPSVNTNNAGVYRITYSIPESRAADRHERLFTLTVREPDSAWLTVSVTTPTLVETLKSVLDISTQSAGYETASLTAYLMADGRAQYPTKLTDGKGRMTIEKTPPAGTYALVVKTGEGLEAGRCEITVAAYNPELLWRPSLQKDPDGSLIIIFGDKISAKDGKFDTEVTVGGQIKSCSQLLDHVLKVDALFGSIPPGTAVVASGIKYPALFPSYSFTFQMVMPESVG